ncbi:MAG: hypothetical protein DHS20C14_08830 [Phycisphaeraceae bacterium]|nr:MAG: hypothetical protein DHS20C14_08830 [Phycisphaeraceae bacterium]
MWALWLAVHAATLAIDGTTAPYALLGAVSMGALLAGTGLGGLAMGRAGSLRVGIGSGLGAGILALLLLGAKVVQQPESTDEMTEAANQLRPDWLAIVFGFLAVCTLVGAVGGLVGGISAPRERAGPGADRWLAWFGVIATAAMLPVIMVGGAVTSTESGMAVPDGVTSYGAFSALFPISLMSEPRIFLEHSHRLFGTLVGLTALALAFATAARQGWAKSKGILIGLAFIVPTLAAWVLRERGEIGVGATVAVLGVCAVGSLGWTHAMISRGKAPAAAMGLVCLVLVQGALGATRVSDALVAIAAVHGVFAQFVFATGAMVAALLFSRLHAGAPLDEATTSTARSTRKLALIALIITSIQLIFGAMARHFDSMHSVLTHAGFAFVVIIMAILAGSACRRAGAGDPIGRALRRTGAAMFVIVVLQFTLGWGAFIATQMGGTARPVPDATELAQAHPLPVGEAIVTTAHQTGGALLIALIALGVFWSRRAARGAAESPRNA